MCVCVSECVCVCVYGIPKRTKLSTIFMVKTGSNFMVKYLFFMVKTLIFVVKTDFLMFRPTNFLVRSQNILVNLHSIPMPKFHAQPYSIPILCSTPFHSNSISWSVTVSIYLHPKSATPSCLTSVSFECSLGTVTILHQRCRI